MIVDDLNRRFHYMRETFRDNWTEGPHYVYQEFPIHTCGMPTTGLLFGKEFCDFCRQRIEPEKSDERKDS